MQYYKLESIEKEQDLHWYLYSELLLLERGFQSERLERLQLLREDIKDEERKTKLSDILQAYSSGKKRTLKKRIQEFSFLESQRTSLDYEKKETLRANLLLAFMGMFAISFFTMAFTVHKMNRNIFSKIRRLSKKIEDFIEGYYIYQFTQPPANELGNLEASFNHMAEKVMETIEDLKELDAAKSEFINIVSHELRTPMTSIKGSLALISSGKFGELNEKTKGLLNIAVSETDRLVRMTNDFLDLAKIESRSFSLMHRWVSADLVIKKSVESLQGLQAQAKVNIQWQSRPEFEINVDLDRMQQVLTNLLSNAIKFTPEGKRIDVRTEVKDKRLYFWVKDEGPGISAEDQDKIFKKFRQATSPDRPLVKGTGLGLSIAKALVEAHEGEIGVQSKLGSGSEFFFTIPEYRINFEKQKAAA